jgi:hypothetical protein
MSDTDHLIRVAIDRVYPPPAGAPDWDDVLRRVPRDPARRPRLLVAAALVLGAAATLLALGVPWRSSPSFTDRALAAIGSQRYLYAVVEPERSYTSVVDLSTGKERPITLRQVLLFDSGSTQSIPTLSFWSYEGNVVTSSSNQGSPTGEPGLGSFLDGYRQQLADGSAKVVGDTTYRGRQAKILRFTFNIAMTAVTVPSGQTFFDFTPYPGGSSEDVAVDSSTYRPLWIRRNWIAITGSQVRHKQEQRYRIVSIASTAKPPARPVAVMVDGYSRPAFNQVTLNGARTVLGARALWAGTKLGRLRFRRVQLDDLFRIRAPQLPLESSVGLRFSYGSRLEVREATTPQPAYRFNNPKLLPADGELRLSCDGCGITNEPATLVVWSGQIKKGHLWVSIEAPTRALVLTAAHALVPLP